MTKKLIGVSILGSLAMAIALTAFAETAPPPSSTPPPPPSHEHTTTVDLACMQNAVDKRDTAMIAAEDAFHTAVVKALTDRRTALKAAWGLTDKDARRVALKDAWKAYRLAVKKARKDFRDADHMAWKQFKIDRRACGGHGESEDKGTEGDDAKL